MQRLGLCFLCQGYSGVSRTSKASPQQISDRASTTCRRTIRRASVQHSLAGIRPCHLSKWRSSRNGVALHDSSPRTGEWAQRCALPTFKTGCSHRQRGAQRSSLPPSHAVRNEMELVASIKNASLMRKTNTTSIVVEHVSPGESRLRPVDLLQVPGFAGSIHQDLGLLLVCLPGQVRRLFHRSIGTIAPTMVSVSSRIVPCTLATIALGTAREKSLKQNRAVLLA